MKLYTTVASVAFVISSSLTVASSAVAADKCTPGDRREGCPRVTQVEKEQEEPKTGRGDGRRDVGSKKESPVGRGDGRRKASKEDPKTGRGEDRDDRMNGGSDKPVTFPPSGSPKGSHGGTR